MQMARKKAHITEINNSTTVHDRVIWFLYLSCKWCRNMHSLLSFPAIYHAVLLNIDIQI
jgi:hypothetical protein